MRLPIPKNKLVAFTLAGALLTAVIAGGLAFPIPGVTAGDTAGDSGTQSTGAPQSATDAPTPNQDFTPAVQTQTGYEGEEHQEYEEDDEGEHEEREEEHDDEYEDEDEAE
jgi:hypothetical protein